VRLDREELYRRALDEWGPEAQVRMLQEECGELIASVNRYSRGRCGAEEVAEEIADVLIMCEQAQLVVGKHLVEEHLQRKLGRLVERLEVSEGESAP
jgi:NTP pyrophosphatase (non-canonical NTP hydrolase)